MLLNESLFEELDDCEECKEEELKEAGNFDGLNGDEIVEADVDFQNFVDRFFKKWNKKGLTVSGFLQLTDNALTKYRYKVKSLDECDKQDQELTEKAWKIQVPEESARNFRDALEAEDLAGAAKELQGILDFLENELGDDAAYELDDIRSALAGIDLDRDPDDTVSWADDDDEDYTVGDDFDDNVLTPLWDLLDEYNVWMPV